VGVWQRFANVKEVFVPKGLRLCTNDAMPIAVFEVTLIPRYREVSVKHSTEPQLRGGGQDRRPNRMARLAYSRHLALLKG